MDGMPPGFDGEGNEGEPLGLDEPGDGIAGEPLGGEGDCGPWDPLGCGGVGKPPGLAGDDGEGGDCCGLC